MTAYIKSLIKCSISIKKDDFTNWYKKQLQNKEDDWINIDVKEVYELKKKIEKLENFFHETFFCEVAFLKRSGASIAESLESRVDDAILNVTLDAKLVSGLSSATSEHLILGCKARALLQGRSHVTIEDVQALAAPVLRHRIVVGFAAESEGVTADSIINQLIETTPAHEDELMRDPRFQTIFAH